MKSNQSVLDVLYSFNIPAFITEIYIRYSAIFFLLIAGTHLWAYSTLSWWIQTRDEKDPEDKAMTQT